MIKKLKMSMLNMALHLSAITIQRNYNCNSPNNPPNYVFTQPTLFL